MEEETISVVKKRAGGRARINDQIRAREVRVIDGEGEQRGVLLIQEARELAEASGLDLVEISPNAEPPVCRVMDYGKFLFEQSKKQAAAKKKQKVVTVKEIKFRPVTEEGDYQVKLRNLIRFLENGDRTKVTMRFRGREMAHQEIGFKLMDRIKVDLVEYGSIEQEPKREGRQIVMVFAPKKK